VQAGTKSPQVLVIDDEPEMCICLEKCLQLLGCSVQWRTSGPEGLAYLEHNRADIVFTDLRMPGMGGIEVVRSVARLAPATRSIVLTGYGTIGSAVEAIRAGAADYLTKPFKIDEIRVAIEKLLAADKPDDQPDTGILGNSQPMHRLRAHIQQIAKVASSVLIRGETGVGKELVAKAVHSNSERRMRPFVAVNCAAISENLLESELFGYEKGAFTGALATRPGKIEAANRGTLFLDEIGETSPSFQAALLRVLQEREVMRVGGTAPIKVDFRLIAATNRDLPAMVQEGTFRQDLYYRLNVVCLDIPPLRERTEDIAELVEHFIRKHRSKVEHEITGISPQALITMSCYRWPGNIRQLENAVEKAIVLSPGPVIGPDDLPAEITCGEADDEPLDYFDSPLRDAKDHFECDYLLTRLKEAQGNVSEAARNAGVARVHFHERLRKYRIDPHQFRV